MRRVAFTFLSFLLLVQANASECIQTKIGSATVVFSQFGSAEKIAERFVKSFGEDFYFRFQREKDLNSSMRNAIAMHSSGATDQTACIDGLIAELAFGGFWLDSESQARIHCLVNQDQSGVPLTNVFRKTNSTLRDSGVFFDQTLLTDWQMAESTVAGAIIDDRTTGNRFICPIHPGQSTSFSLLYDSAFLDDRAVPLVSFFSPIDWRGEQAVGSWKGKAIALRSSGLVSRKELDLGEIPTISINAHRLRDTTSIERDNGMKVCDLPSNLFSVPLNGNALYRDHHNLSVLEYQNPALSHDTVKIADFLGIEGHCLKVLHVTKRDKGFHQLSSLVREVDENAVFVIVNCLQLPDGYGHFFISEDLSHRGLPLVQFYRLDPSQALVLRKKEMNHLSLTPCEEFLFRETETAAQLNTHLKSRIHSELIIFIYR